MPTITTQTVIDDVNTILNDVLKARWPEAELIRYLNHAQLAIVARRPDASVLTTTFSCAAAAKQTLPATALRLIDVLANRATGAAITLIDADVLNEQIPNWRDAGSPVAKVEHYVYDDRNPKVFYTYPVPTGGLELDVVYSVAPTEATGGGTITIDDIYLNPIVDYMLYRCYQKDTENPANAARAGSHYSAFLRALGDKTQTDAAASPNNG